MQERQRSVEQFSRRITYGLILTALAWWVESSKAQRARRPPPY
jgi:hypothetical protein